MREYIFSQWADCFSENDVTRHSIKFRVKLIKRIDIKRMENSVNKAIKSFPYFSVRLCTDRLTLFFEHNDKPVPVLSGESESIRFGSDAVNQHYLFFTVKDEWLLFDISHILTDGCGAKRFLKVVLFLYCRDVYNKNLSWSDSELFQKSVLNPSFINPLEKFNTTQKYDFNNYYSASPVQITNMMKLDASPTLFRLKIKESELIRFIKNNDGTPNVLFSLLLNKAINKILSHSNGIRSLICVNSRKYLNAPTAHQNLVSSAMLPYFESYEKLPVAKLLSMLKGLLNFECLEEIQKNKLSENIYRQRIISQGLTLYDKYKIYSDLLVNNADLATNTISYIRNEGWDCLSNYITDCSIISTLFTDISIELTILNGYFYVDFYQKFAEEMFYREFLNQLQILNLPYVEISTEEVKVCQNIIPDFLQNSLGKHFVEEKSVCKISQHPLFEFVLNAVESDDFRVLEKQIRTQLGLSESVTKSYYLDGENLDFICKRLVNPIKVIPFFVILFSVPLIKSITCKFDFFNGPEILLKCLIRLADISSKLKVSGVGDFEIECLRESFLCFKKSTCSEIFYIIVNNSEHDEIITLSDQPYWIELFSGDKYDLITNFECKSQEFYLMYHTENNYV